MTHYGLLSLSMYDNEPSPVGSSTTNSPPRPTQLLLRAAGAGGSGSS